MRSLLRQKIQTLINITFIALSFAIPLFFGPWVDEPFDFNKSLLIIGATASLLILWLTRLTIEGELKWWGSPFDVPLFILILALTLSSFFSLNRLMSWTRLELWLWLCGPILYFVYTNNRVSHEPKTTVSTFDSNAATLKAIKSAGFLLSLIALSKSLGFQTPEFALFNQPDFTPIGGVISLDLYLILLLILELPTLKSFFAPNLESQRRPVFAFLPPLLYLGLISAALISTNPLTRPVEGLDVSNAWQVAAEVLKTRPVQGAGPGLYPEAFALFKPFSFNNSDAWAKIFPQSANTFFHFLTTFGLAGLIVFLLVFLAFGFEAFRSLREGRETLPVALTFLITSFFFSLWNPALIYLFFILLALVTTPGHETHFILAEDRGQRRLLPHLISLPIILVAILGLAGLQRILAAQLTIKTANDLLWRQAPLIPVYNAFAQAARLNPYDPVLRTSFSTISLSSAEAIIRNANERGERLTSQDQEFIKNLITQARREADAAVNLNPLSFQNFENRGLFYKRISGLASDAAELAVEDYKSAILKSPNSPILRARLGVIQRDVQKDLIAAEATLIQAVSLKPNFAEAHWELARTYGFLEKKEAALAEYTAALEAAQDRTEVKEKILEEKKSFEERGLIAIKEILFSPQEMEQEQARQIVKSVEEIQPSAKSPQVKLENSKAATPIPTPTSSPTPSPQTSEDETTGTSDEPATATPTPTPTATATPIPTPSPTPTSSPTPSPTPTPGPTSTP